MTSSLTQGLRPITAMVFFAEGVQILRSASTGGPVLARDGVGEVLAGAIAIAFLLSSLLLLFRRQRWAFRVYVLGWFFIGIARADPNTEVAINPLGAVGILFAIVLGLTEAFASAPSDNNEATSNGSDEGSAQTR